MNDKTKSVCDAWEELFHQHRGSEMAILLAECLRLGLRNGTITSDSVRHIPVINGSIRGAVFKALRRGGMFSKVGYTASKAEGRNSSVIAIWQLDNPATARLLLQKFAGQFSATQNGTEKQLELC